MSPNLEEAVPATIEEHVKVNNATNQLQILGTPDTTKRPPAPVGSKAGNRPTTQAYNRYNETERKERETIAEDWIQTGVKKRLFTNRSEPVPNHELAHPDTLLFEYAMYTKDHSFINAFRAAVAGMIVSNETFACCVRGTSKETGLPIQPSSETDESPSAV